MTSIDNQLQMFRSTGQRNLLVTNKDEIETSLNDYYVFDGISGVLLENQISIFEVVLSKIHQEISKQFDTIDGMNNPYLYQTIHAKLKKLIYILEVNKMAATNVFISKPSADLLADTNLKATIVPQFIEILNDFKHALQIISNRQIKDYVLIIDDISFTSNSTISKMLKDMKQYLNGQMIIIIKAMESELLNPLMVQYSAENRLLLETNTLGTDDIIARCKKDINDFFIKL